jgi:hypothetical protein
MLARFGLVASLSLAAGGALAQDHYDVAGTRIPAFVLIDGCPSEGACAGPNGSANPLFVAPAAGAAWASGLVSASPPSGLSPGVSAQPSMTEYGALRVVIDTPSGTEVDVTQAQPTYPYASTSWTVNDVSCTSAGTVVALADSTGAAKQRSFVNVSPFPPASRRAIRRRATPGRSIATPPRPSHSASVSSSEALR